MSHEVVQQMLDELVTMVDQLDAAIACEMAIKRECESRLDAAFVAIEDARLDIIRSLHHVANLDARDDIERALSVIANVQDEILTLFLARGAEGDVSKIVAACEDLGEEDVAAALREIGDRGKAVEQAWKSANTLSSAGLQ